MDEIEKKIEINRKKKAFQLNFLSSHCLKLNRVEVTLI
jgi:hypothetical protein